MITIILLYKTGGDYDIDYVKRIANAIRRNTTVEYKIKLVTDEIASIIAPLISHGIIDSIDYLTHGLPGWWAKVRIFITEGPVLYLDLDTIITGSLDAIIKSILSIRNEIIMLRGFYRPDYCSGIMGWNADFSWLYDLYMEKYLPKAKFSNSHHAIRMKIDRTQFRGDQEWLQYVFKNDRRQHVLLIQDLVPDAICSYKVHIQETEMVPEGASIVCFHGKPRPHEITPIPEWMKIHWFGNKNAHD